MIELTQEQWQAIALEENPTVIDPRSKTAYVVVRKEEYQKLQTVMNAEADSAYVLRIAWMRRMGLNEDEIAESIRDDPPLKLQDELKQLRALDNLTEITPPAEVLQSYAVKY